MTRLIEGPRFGVWLLAIGLALLGLGTGSARADDCAGTSFKVISPDHATLTLDVRFQDDTWQARVATVGKTDGSWRILVGIPTHAHLLFVGPSPDGTFAVVRQSAERDHAGRVVFYNGFITTRSRPDLAAPRRRLDLKDLLTPAELAATSQSISHLRWLEGATPVSALKVDPEGLSFMLRVVGGRQVLVSSRPR